MKRQPWTADQISTLRRMYPTHRAEDIAAALGRAKSSVYNKAQQLGLAKSSEWIAADSRRTGNGKASRFQPGQTSWNKGTKGVTGNHPNTRKTQFKAGQPPHTTLPMGSYRVNSSGVLEQKTGEQSGPPHLRWTPVSRQVWEAVHGPVPAGSVVVFKPGMATTDLEKITIDRLECLTRRELMLRNTVHKYGPEVAQLSRLRGTLTRQIRNMEKQHAE